MEVGTLVWVRNPGKHEGRTWIAGEVLRKTFAGGAASDDGRFNLDIKALNERKQLQIVKVSSTQSGDDVLDARPRDNDEESPVEDLVRLTHLHEPAILHNLERRFSAGNIYTYTGPILIAVNPFKDLNLYNDSILKEHYERGVSQSQGVEDLPPLPPHVYAITASAFQDMVQRMRGGGACGRDAWEASSQSILISGESGSGKTVSTKHCLSYLSSVGRMMTGNQAKVRILTFAATLFCCYKTSMVLVVI